MHPLTNRTLSRFEGTCGTSLVDLQDDKGVLVATLVEQLGHLSILRIKVVVCSSNQSSAEGNNRKRSSPFLSSKGEVGSLFLSSSPLFAQAVPPTEHWVFHFNSANLVLQSPRTLAAVAARYVAREDRR